jgi:type I restriction enzyme M protein
MPSCCTLRSLKSTGKGAIILPHGCCSVAMCEGRYPQEYHPQGLYQGHHRPAANLFYGTGIPACIIVLDKETQRPQGIFMIDASKGFMKDGNKNRLRHQDIHKIVDVFTARSRSQIFPHGPLAEIEANDFNLNIPRYIDSSEPEDLFRTLRPT